MKLYKLKTIKAFASIRFTKTVWATKILMTRNRNRCVNAKKRLRLESFYLDGAKPDILGRHCDTHKKPLLELR